jgi:hypothetical protein
MLIDHRAEGQWNRAQHAYDHYQQFINAKSDRYALSFADFACVKNFKGGSATIAEPVATFAPKLLNYERAIRLCAADPAFGLTLSTILIQDYARVRNLIVDFGTLSETAASHINGFRCSFASALLHFHFPRVVPILDKRALNGSGVPGIQVDRFNNVTNLLALYPKLIDACRARLLQRPNLTLRELDRLLFIEQLVVPPFH